MARSFFVRLVLWLVSCAKEVSAGGIRGVIRLERVVTGYRPKNPCSNNKTSKKPERRKGPSKKPKSRKDPSKIAPCCRRPTLCLPGCQCPPTGGQIRVGGTLYPGLAHHRVEQVNPMRIQHVPLRTWLCGA